MHRLPRYARPMCRLSARLILLWFAVPDFDYCGGCYDAHWQDHHDGEHRFVLLRYPTPGIVLERAIASLKKLTGDADPWKLADRPVPDTTAPQEDGGEPDATATEGMSRISSRVAWSVSTERH